ncbi:hypothetical protein BD414DRAFT_475552 [Trametes punicea]|nr:hypothetical protein BD414DRAFT_475552 [Trametes punicea]
MTAAEEASSDPNADAYRCATCAFCRGHTCNPYTSPRDLSVFMTRVDPPYPSISYVLSNPQARNAQSSRLPAYRSTHVGRYHPYPRAEPGRYEDRIMVAGDRHEAEELALEGPLVVPRRRVTTCVEMPDGDSHPYEDDPLPVVGVESDIMDAYPSANIGDTAAGSLSKVVAAISELLVAMRRKYLAVQAVKEFLDVKRPKSV